MVTRLDNGTYALGIRLLELGNLVKSRINIREVALPLMQRLHEELGESVNLGIRHEDEIVYVEQELKLATVTSRYLREGRALGITVVATTQRPAGVSRTLHSETAWSVFFAPKDEEDAERMAQIAGNKTYFIRAIS